MLSWRCVQANRQVKQLMSKARTSLAGDLDGLFPDSLRNILFGKFGEDLFTHNAFRAAEIGMQPYEVLAKCFRTKPDAQVRRVCH